MLKNKIATLFLILLPGCSILPTKQEKIYVPVYPTIPTELLKDCKRLEPLSGGDGKTISLWITDAISSNKECAASKKAIVNIITSSGEKHESI